MKITKMLCENLEHGCVTDNPQPRFSFVFESDKQNVKLWKAHFSLENWSRDTDEQVLVPYAGARLTPFRKYTATVRATDSTGETDTASCEFYTGRMGTPWAAEWITDGEYKFTEKHVSPAPMVFRKNIRLKKEIDSAFIYSTALGIYEIDINGHKVGSDYFAPGFTSYKNTLQYQTYDVSDVLCGDDDIVVTVAGGWAVGSFIFTRRNRITAPRQAFIMELRIKYIDGSEEVIGTDESWLVSRNGNYRAADFYDGETYDATVVIDDAIWRKASVEKIKIKPSIVAQLGVPVRRHEKMEPVSAQIRSDGEIIYDFGQNFAGVVSAEIKGKKGQTVVFRHAEVLTPDGGLCVEPLRSAKATATYICRDGMQNYSPRLTYMGFRYVAVSGIDKEDISLCAYALYSDIDVSGSFECSDEMLNKLQSNIVWSAKSNFVDIPTDCPQRDERMGWTGDIALFARTASYNFDTSRFYDKWLGDLRSEQLRSGGVPNTIPSQGYGFPTTMPKMAVDFWGDACVLVPWAEYLARGDEDILVRSYVSMRNYVEACKFWANFCSIGKKRYIWHTFSMFHFGDWVAPDAPKMSDWQKRSKWTATASLYNTANILANVAETIGISKDAARYRSLAKKVAAAYVKVFTDGKGKLKKEFQTGYVLPLYFGMFPPEQRQAAADNLAELVRRNDYKIGTGFPGTPYILFALADNGHADEAYKMLLNTECPSWLYAVKAGGTTVWERWDGITPDGRVNIAKDGTGGMLSFNHYAFGSVGDFMYRRILGMEPLAGGYRKYRVRPVLGGGITYARGNVKTPFGKASTYWRIDNGKFRLEIVVPACCECVVELPDGTVATSGSGKYEFECDI